MTTDDRLTFRVYGKIAKSVVLQVVYDLASKNPAISHEAKRWAFSDSPGLKAARVHWLSHAELAPESFDRLADADPEHLRRVMKRKGRFHSLARWP